jgi:phosphatidate phosphatase APP1
MPTTSQAQRAMKAETAAGLNTVVLFDVAAHLDAERSTWMVPAHVWVYRAQDSRARKAAIAALFKSKYGLEVTSANDAVFDRRINLLLADNKGRQRVAVSVASEQALLSATAANGHALQTIEVPVFPGVPITGGGSVIETSGGRSARLQLVPPEGVSIICDIDDTVKDSGVLDRRRLWQSTFFEPFKAVPGMAALLQRIAGGKGAVHYVSSSPWHLYAPLREWLEADGFPVAALHLKQIRLKDSTLLDILRSPQETKPPVITSILERWPKRQFVLIGDSGEKDPEVYGAVARAAPSQIARILIRRAPGDLTGTARMETAFAGLPRPLWQVFDDPSAVTI